MPFTYEYPRPSVTVDAAIFSVRDDELAVLLIERKRDPCRGAWALPGGFVDADEGLEVAVARELEEETSLREIALTQFGAYGDPGRDPRGHTVTVAYVGFVAAGAHAAVAGDDAARVAWHPLRTLPMGLGAPTSGPRLAFDHAVILADALAALRRRHADPTLRPGVELVPPEFTLSELQRVYEAVHGQRLDKRNFRAKLLGHHLVESVLTARRSGRHRPAQLFRWVPAPAT